MSKVLLHKKKRNYGTAIRRVLTISAIIVVLCVIAFYIVLTKSGQWLVQDDEFEHVSWVAILDGQSADMERSNYAIDLVAEGKADSVLILGRRVLRDRSNAEFYAEDFVQHSSIDSGALFLARHDDPSTISEAFTIIPWLKSRKADTVLLLTTAAATKRVAGIFQSLAGESPVFLTKDIQHYLYDAETWYINRESRKNWLREWAALFYSKFELNGDTLTENDSAYFAPIRSLREEKTESVVDLQRFLKQTQSKTQEVIKESKDSTAKADTTKAEAKKDEKKDEKKSDAKKDDKKDEKKDDKKSDSKKDADKKSDGDKKNSSKK